MKAYDKVEVKWADHWQDEGDLSIEDVIKKARPEYGNYLGYLVYENKQMIVLCANVWDDGAVSDPMYIMKKAITYRSDKVKK